MEKNKNIVKAINRNVRSSPRKINILLKNIRGKKADIAIRDLSFARQRVAFEVKKTVQSLKSPTILSSPRQFGHISTRGAHIGYFALAKRQYCTAT